jgi:hypothetical protein
MTQYNEIDEAEKLASIESDYEEVNNARIYCICDSNYFDEISLARVCPIHRVTILQAIEGYDIPFPQNDRRSHVIPSENINEFNPCREYSERRQYTRRSYNRETMPVYQDPLEMLWVAQVETMKGDFQAMAIIEAATEKEAIAKIEKELTDVGIAYQGFFVTQLSGIDFTDDNGVYKI